MHNVERMTPEEIRDALKRLVGGVFDPKTLFRELSSLLPQYLKPDTDQKTKDKIKEKIIQAVSIIGLETHYPLAETTCPTYQPLIIEFSNLLIQEYGCTTAGERALAEITAGAYVRVLECSRALHERLNPTYLSHEGNGYFASLSKELDRAERHFTTALTMLKRLKCPELDIQVKTQTAFIAQNQQNVASTDQFTNALQ